MAIMYAARTPYGRSASGARFCTESTRNNAPSWIAQSPSARITCGGDRTFTSRPYALCHQLSNGPDVIIASAPQMHTQAPSGARKPQNRTPASRSAPLAAKVVRNASQPQAVPASTPPR